MASILGLILSGANLLHVEAIQLLSVTGASRRIGFQRQSPARHIHINPFSSITHNRISFISSHGKHQLKPVSNVRRDVSLVNIARETDNMNHEMGSAATLSFDSSSINRDYNVEDEEYLDVDSNDDGDDDQPSEPICRVVATSDAKIPPMPVYSSLSMSSKTLVKQLELLYAAQSQKKLRGLTYLPSLDESQVEEETQDQKLISTVKQSLEDGGFKLMDQRDFDLCSALNAGYLLRLSLLPDLKDLDPKIGQQFYPDLFIEDDRTQKKLEKSSNGKLLFDGKVLVFRRGYSQEVTTGRLLLPKLDYLQASLVQRSSASLTRKLGVVEQRLEDFVAKIMSGIYDTVVRWWLRFLLQIQTTVLDILKSSGLLTNNLVTKIVDSNNFLNADFAQMLKQDNNGTIVQKYAPTTTAQDFRIRGNKIFRLSRYGVGEKYSTFNVIANSLDISDALSPFSLCELGTNDTTSIERDMYNGLDAGYLKCQYDEIYNTESTYKQPATVRLLERVSIQNTVNFFSENGRRDLVKNFFRKSTLKEPSFEEIVVIWRPRKRKALKKKLSKFTTLPNWLYGMSRIFDVEDKLPERVDNENELVDDDAPAKLEIRAFNDVPMANMMAVLPKTKLIFRPADALVFDLVSVVSFFALGASLKFDNPRLDLLAVVALSAFAVRTFFRYSNKYARYDLLVNKFLTKKLAHRSSGALNYIVSQADSQRALRSGLIRDWLSENNICMSAGDNDANNLLLDYDVLELGKAFANEKAATNEARIDVDILSAIDELNSLGLIEVVKEDKSLRFKVKDDESSLERVQQLWNDVLSK
jgi:hypothetical protein